MWLVRYRASFVELLQTGTTDKDGFFTFTAFLLDKVRSDSGAVLSALYSTELATYTIQTVHLPLTTGASL